jgi:hypothetical protein
MLEGYIDRFLALIGAKQPAEAADSVHITEQAFSKEAKSAPRTKPLTSPAAAPAPRAVAGSSSPTAEKPRAVGSQQVAVTVSTKVASAPGKNRLP